MVEPQLWPVPPAWWRPSPVAAAAQLAPGASGAAPSPAACVAGLSAAVLEAVAAAGGAGSRHVGVVRDFSAALALAR
ncbi:unnamed protein product [Prorocentrum cordatum]|uniref:Uncharacterized protein n=1 Tax=Prorocentrum cordatum TaxID=2364126 RepID=A0ABN9YC00_9DINO|nr:unnamed protein product [Polarella glacialis]